MRIHHSLNGSPCGLFQTSSLAAAMVFLTGCTVGPDYVSPDISLNTLKLGSSSHYSQTYRVSDEAISKQWWSLFNDPILSDLEERALNANFDLQLMASRIAESRANLGITTADFQPTVSASGSYVREDISDNGKFAALGAKPSGNNYWQTGFDASWEVDLWGHIQRAQEGASAQLEATILNREAFKVTLMAEVASDYLRFRGIQAQIRIAKENKQIAEKKLALVKSRVINGFATNYEIAMAKAQLASISAMIPSLNAQRDAQMNKLALLLGELPNAMEKQLIQDTPLPAMPKEIPIGVPAQLAQKRPDVLSAEAQLHQATAEIGVAESNFYPRITLVGSAGFEAFESSDIDSWGSGFFSVGPAIYLPIFQGGKLKQRLKLTEEKQKSAALVYRKTLLNAWHEVDNALDDLASQRTHHNYTEQAYHDYKRALHFAQRHYQEGAGSYLEVLTAQQQVLSSQIALNDSATKATISLVTLYKALGGGWDLSNPSQIVTEANTTTSMDEAHSKSASEYVPLNITQPTTSYGVTDEN
ncbi:efflux transporter outer membrane subunit [Alteromonas sp. 14N.309.X.WAT.G.H12]|uniref:efflux transporter outer membrane subunit n=1 Tax=Alteromonas sp. 14N.309.X.WAT.G.H12 TaxID=3120824 RepID=UPI002FD1E87C